jgi:GNAT superfamily N-acetyltransferase
MSATVEPSVEVCIRPFEPWMQEHVVAVVRAVHDEYGFMWDFAGYHRDLYDVRGAYLDVGGMFWTLALHGQIVGCVGVTPHGSECELHRLYLRHEGRGRGHGQRMLDTALDWGRARGCRAMIAWSDVKLGLAHRLYLANGFVLFGQRLCDDPDHSIEYGFRKEPL